MVSSSIYNQHNTKMFKLNQLFYFIEFSSTNKKLFLLCFSIFFFALIPLFRLKNSRQLSLVSPPPNVNISDLLNRGDVEECDIFRGQWIPYPKGPSYYNESCKLNKNNNCMKFGTKDRGYMKWRWKPEECELPFFDAMQFLELVRGKSMAFVGDSLARNQFQSLLCMLSSVAYPEDLSENDTTDFRVMFYSSYNFTLSTLWSKFLVKSSDVNGTDRWKNLYLDEANEAWTNQVENFDYVIISSGQWFMRPLYYYMNGKIIGCNECNQENITDLGMYYGYRMAFRTTFETLEKLKKYRAITFLRTFSPSHFENGKWNEGGICPRKRPYNSEEMKLGGSNLYFYLTQVDEFRKAEKRGKKKGLKFKLLSTTEAMWLRPDGHPYIHTKVNLDCLHWCLPGPIDTCNEFLFYVMKMEAQRSYL